jgi:hypothetical protein
MTDDRPGGAAERWLTVVLDVVSSSRCGELVPPRERAAAGQFRLAGSPRAKRRRSSRGRAARSARPARRGGVSRWSSTVYTAGQQRIQDVLVQPAGAGNLARNSVRGRVSLTSRRAARRSRLSIPSTRSSAQRSMASPAAVGRQTGTATSGTARNQQEVVPSAAASVSVRMAAAAPGSSVCWQPDSDPPSLKVVRNLPADHGVRIAHVVADVVRFRSLQASAGPTAQRYRTMSRQPPAAVAADPTAIRIGRP